MTHVYVFAAHMRKKPAAPCALPRQQGDSEDSPGLLLPTGGACCELATPVLLPVHPSTRRARHPLRAQHAHPGARTGHTVPIWQPLCSHHTCHAVSTFTPPHRLASSGSSLPLCSTLTTDCPHPHCLPTRFCDYCYRWACTQCTRGIDGRAAIAVSLVGTHAHESAHICRRTARRLISCSDDWQRALANEPRASNKPVQKPAGTLATAVHMCAPTATNRQLQLYAWNIISKQHPRIYVRLPATAGPLPPGQVVPCPNPSTPLTPAGSDVSP